MDLLLGFFCIIFALISTGVIYFVLVPSLKEKSYDEAKAEQKKKVEEYLAQGRSAKEKAKDKKLKKAGKKVKEKMSSESVEVSSEEAEPAKAHVAFTEPPVVDEEPPVLIEEKKKKKNKKEKPILMNKHEHTAVVDTPPTTVNHFEQTVPKDDCSLKRSVSREEIEPKPVESAPPAPAPAPQKQTSKAKAQPANPPKEPKAEKSQSQKPTQPALKASEKTNAKGAEKGAVKPGCPAQPKAVEEVAVRSAVKPALENSSLSPSTKNSRKKRSDLATLQQMSGEKEAVNMTLLMPLVHKAELSRTEIQVLIDCLLNKQQNSSVDSAEWIEGRQDPVVKLKKQLAEKEKALAEEQEAGAALQSKLRELRTELNAERHAGRALEEGMQARGVELATLTGRLQLSTEEKQAVVQQVQTLQAKLSEEHLVLCKLQEDQEQTRAALQQELLAQRQQLESHIARLTQQHQETITALEGQLGQVASQLQEQEALNTQLSGELRDRGNGSQDLARQVKDLHAEIERVKSKSKYESNRLQGEASSVTEQLVSKRAEVDKLNTLVTSLQADITRLSHQVTSVTREAQQLRDENETLAAQVTASMERPATEGRENGDISYETKIIDNGSVLSPEKESLLEQLKDEVLMKEKEISHVKSDLAQQEVVVKRLKEELDAAQSTAERLLKEVSSYKSLVAEHESVISALREEGDSAHQLVSTLRQDIAKQKAEIAQLSRECEQLDSRSSTIEKLTSELNTHKTRLADQAALIQTLQRDVDKHKASGDLSIEVNKYKTQLEQKEAAMTALTAQVSRLSEDLSQLRSALAESQETQGRLSRDAHEYEAKLTSLRQEVDTQRRKNNEAEQQMKQEEQERTKQLLQRILPHVSVDGKQEYEAWLEKFMACVRDSVDSDESHGAMLAEVEQQNCQLQAMVTHYKAIIADTEGMLNRLQSHVEQEEGRWGQQIQTLEAQLEAVIQERDRLEAAAQVAGHSTVDAGSDTN